MVSFYILDASKVDELIREAKRAKAEGREFKFDYQKLLPDYDNPFQRKKEDPLFPQEKEVTERQEESRPKVKLVRDRKDSRKSDKYDRRHSDHKKDDRKRDDDRGKREDDRGKRDDDRDKDRYKDKDSSSKDKDKSKDRDKEKEKIMEDVKKDTKSDEDKVKEKVLKEKETDVNLNDYLVCDSWSLDNDDKNTASPKVDGKNAKLLASQQVAKSSPLIKENLKAKDDVSLDSPKLPKMEKLQPVIDSFKFEIDPNEDDALDIFDEDSELEKFARPTSKKDPYDSPIDLKLFDYDQDLSKEGVIDANDDNFLESVINEIKQENMSDDTSQDKGLVEYDMSPKDDYDDSKNSLGSVTPELDDRMRDLQSSQRSNYSDGYRSTESGYKSTESGYKSTESYKPSESYKTPEPAYKSSESSFKSLDPAYKSKKGYKKDNIQPNEFSLADDKDDLIDSKMSKSTVDSLETWSFVLKICQPLLFRHDKNKCYK